MASNALKTVIVPPVGGGFPSATVFLLHGLGDTASGWTDVARMLGQNQSLQHVRFVLPTAPVQPVTINMGMSMTSWFDIYSLTDIEQDEDKVGLLKSTESVRSLVQKEIDGSAEGLNGHGVPSERIVVAGFSQGGAIALLLGLTTTWSLAGVAGLSTWLPLRKQILELRANPKPFPIFEAHGTADQIVNFAFGKATYEGLRDQLHFGDQIEFHEYAGMMHSACPQEIQDLKQWLEKVIPI
ncbi:lysophospholipase [Malassezia yamatoensis]|uniref:Acyl-protein thioesterase 1 n=1 Tax=Malassezia yamatoensis TaxID=253288 RepID=A0AAJ5YPB8_9BASI|nr:lysophospholipase [Malassezia yamatoensis]